MLKKKPKYRHLDIEDRYVIEAMIMDKKSMSEIARTLKVDKSTVSREIRKHTIVVGENNFNSTLKCSVKGNLGLCNICKKRNFCYIPQRYYKASKAHEVYLGELKNSRTSTRINLDDLKRIDKIVTDGVQLGQSLHHIYVSNPELNNLCCERTLRRLVYRGNLSVKCHELRRYVRFKHEYKKNRGELSLRDIRVLIGRTYKDFRRLTSRNKSKNVVEYDSVIGKRTDEKAILTITFKKYNFQFGRLIDKDSPDDVVKIMRSIFRAIGSDMVEKIFPINLADNGLEFSYFNKIEFDSDGVQICKTFFTTPYRSTDKAHCERNHELVRYIFPKGKSLDNVTQEMLDEAFSNINSYTRKVLNDRTPYDLVKNKYGEEFLNKIGIRRIAKKKVRLTRII